MHLKVAQERRTAYTLPGHRGVPWRCSRTLAAIAVMSAMVFLLCRLQGSRSCARDCPFEVYNTSLEDSVFGNCPKVPPGLVGKLNVVKNPPSFEEQEKIFVNISAGGKYIPRECEARHRVALLIPYRDRTDHLRVFIYHMHHFLRRQQLEYQIFVVEQAGNSSFNRGKLFNVGYRVASGLYGFECFIFHDVDMIPVNDRNLYTCADHPRHLTVSVDTFNYRLPYQDFFGGALAMTKEHIRIVNGFSNVYWGWGGEDDDMFYRVNDHGLKVRRYPPDVARYITLSHKPAHRSPSRSKLLQEATTRYHTDGMNNLTYKKKRAITLGHFGWLQKHLQTVVVTVLVGVVLFIVLRKESGHHANEYNSTQLPPNISHQSDKTHSKNPGIFSAILKNCPDVHPNGTGKMSILHDPPSFEEQEKIFVNISAGGKYIPRECEARHRVALVIPYRDRLAQLRVFIYHMHQFLRRQQIEYQIFVVEQAGNRPFNRGKLLNVGYRVAYGLYDFECFIFHDVDLLPLNDRTPYRCSDQPIHLTVSIDKFNYRLPPKGLSIGGACAMTKKHMQIVNGFSNKYWGWGGEDDDLYRRIISHGLQIKRYPMDVVRYIMLHHEQAQPNPISKKLVNEAQTRFSTDGLNSLTFNKLSVTRLKLFTWILAA